MRCAFCEQNAQFHDRVTGHFLCPEHARLEVTESDQQRGSLPLTIRRATPADRHVIERLMLYFWGETTVECFDHEYDVPHLPAFLACDDGKVMGLLSYSEEEATLYVVALNVLPQAQGRGGAQALLEAALAEAQARSLARLMVSTTNDDLPALYLYQRFGFRIVEMIPGSLVKHHGREESGFAGIPVRDEIRLELLLTKADSQECFSKRGKNNAVALATEEKIQTNRTGP
ncbi:MAG: GNAT family N-acetyltransferase [Anaerolineae bacterium]|jgi:ribosomal protein S18 acetylase RimI-like enzyme|nr:GNAT family N-acetyltransferase [Anaerolineae bacterium]MDH7475017.1 GNAT family N-acetyltransferase [Anaerolineae bacterium]